MESTHPAHPNPSIGPRAGDSPALALADLEHHDPRARGGTERRFFCPLPACADHQRKRNLGANVETGRWKCHRCEARGTLREFWIDRLPSARRPPQRAPAAAPPPVAPKPAVVRKQRVGDVRRWRCQDATGAIRGVQCRQDLHLTLADGSQAADKAPWWETPDGRPSKGQVHGTELVYCATPLPEIPEGAEVLVVEGPPKADAGARLGRRYVVALVCGASSTPCGALLDQLARFRCILSPDNDPDGKGQALMRRVAAALLERGTAPRWLVLPVGDKGDLVDYERDGGTPEDLAARIAAAPAAFGVVVAALRAEVAAADCDCPALEAELVAAQGQIRALKTEQRALLAENAELKRQEPRAFIRRLVPELTAFETGQKTKGLGLPLLVMLDERLANVEAGKPAETPLPWWAAEREEQFGRSADTLRTKLLDPLEEHEIIDREYQQLGIRGDGEQGQRLRLSVAPAVPTDLVDGLRFIRRQLLTGKPQRVRPKRSKGCAPCRAAVCADHPTAPIENYVEPRCSECGRAAEPGHMHARRRPATRVAPAVMFPVRPKNSVVPPREDVRPKNSVEPPPPPEILDAALATAEGIAADIGLEHLSPVDAMALKLKLYRQIVQVLQAGQPAPLAADVCDQCGELLAPSECLRCDRCATVGVAS